MWLDNQKLRNKIMLIVAAAFVGMALVCSVSLSNLNDELLEGRKVKVQHLTESAHAIVARYHAEAQAGRLSVEDAKQAAIADLKAIRYGSNDYFWINDMAPAMVMHPMKPELDGKPLADLKGPDGSRIFADMIAVVSKSGGGYYFYFWPKPGFDAPVRKISYVKGFAPWGWVVGTGIYLDDVDAAFRTKALQFAAITVVLTLVVIGISLLIARRVTEPLNGLAGAMKQLAAGDLDIPALALDRQDEVGAMSRALAVFRDAEAERRQLEAERRREQELKDRRQAAVETLTRDFNQGVKDVLGVVSASAQDLRTVAQEMSGVAEDTSSRSATVAAAAEQASANVQTVAAAAEQLAASESEISRQVGRSSQVAQEASAEAERITGIVGGLAEATRQIGDVVNLINDIASQTNLLALNATIEAARAGEAGKGFAVVANEVKNLANQTAKATDEITAQIAAVQGATDDAVRAISGIGRTIAEVNEAAAAIATAVEEQGAATREIARNVQEASQGTREVTTSIMHVSAGASQTGGKAAQVTATADQLINRAQELAGEVADFLDSLKTAGDRRQFERVAVSLSASIAFGAKTVSARLVDASVAGGQLDRDIGVAAGANVQLSVEGWPTIPARVITEAGGHTRLQFVVDADLRRRLGGILAGLAQAA
jgi:methyl-accepting chemotaxis protein